MQRVWERPASKPARRVVWATRGRRGAPNQTTAREDHESESSESEEKWPFGQVRTSNVEPPLSGCDTGRMQRTHVVPNAWARLFIACPTTAGRMLAFNGRTLCTSCFISTIPRHALTEPNARSCTGARHTPRPGRAERPAPQSARTGCPSPRQPARSRSTAPAESRVASETSS